jgi:hypothetical protein
MADMPILRTGDWSIARATPVNPRRNQLRRGLLAVRRSRALASLLPSLLLTGAGSLAASAVYCLFRPGIPAASLGNWMEAWLISWPIAFPLAYLLGRPLLRLALRRKDPHPLS